MMPAKEGHARARRPAHWRRGCWSVVWRSDTRTQAVPSSCCALSVAGVPCMHACMLARCGSVRVSNIARPSVGRTRRPVRARGVTGQVRGVAWRGSRCGRRTSGEHTWGAAARLRACASQRRAPPTGACTHRHIIARATHTATTHTAREQSSVLWRPDLCSPPSSHPVRHTRHRWRRPSGARCGRRLEVRAGPGRVHRLPTATVPSPSLCRRHLFASSALPVPNLRNC